MGAETNRTAPWAGCGQPAGQGRSLLAWTLLGGLATLMVGWGVLLLLLV